VISGEHGIGTQAQVLPSRWRTPVKMISCDASRRAFDPNDILNPGTVI